jgi:hypothetical protein
MHVRQREVCLTLPGASMNGRKAESVPTQKQERHHDYSPWLGFKSSSTAAFVVGTSCQQRLSAVINPDA